jgi:2-polyprenyl-6-methoxyphenol hydroxylase-like FAD-dependent oxidoreductase
MPPSHCGASVLTELLSIAGRCWIGSSTGIAGGPVADEHDLRPSNARYALYLGITRDGLMSGLASAARARIRYGTTIASVAGRPDEPEVTFSDGTRGQFDLVVGADGINSAVRRLIYPDIVPAYRLFCAWRTVMDGSYADPVFRFSSTPGRLLGTFPVGPDLVYAFLLAHCAEVPILSRAARLSSLKELAAQFPGKISELIGQQRDPAARCWRRELPWPSKTQSPWPNR